MIISRNPRFSASTARFVKSSRQPGLKPQAIRTKPYLNFSVPSQEEINRVGILVHGFGTKIALAFKGQHLETTFHSLIPFYEEDTEKIHWFFGFIITPESLEQLGIPVTGLASQGFQNRIAAELEQLTKKNFPNELLDEIKAAGFSLSLHFNTLTINVPGGDERIVYFVAAVYAFFPDKPPPAKCVGECLDLLQGKFIEENG